MESKGLNRRRVGRSFTDGGALGLVLDIARPQLLWQVTLQLGGLALADAPVGDDDAADDGHEGAHSRGGEAEGGRGGGAGGVFEGGTHGGGGAEAADEADGQHHAEPVLSAEYGLEQVDPGKHEQAPLEHEHGGGKGPHVARALGHGPAEVHGIRHGGKHHGDEDSGVVADLVGERRDFQHLRPEDQPDEASGNGCRQQELLQHTDTLAENVADDEEDGDPPNVDKQVIGCEFHEPNLSRGELSRLA